MFWFILIIIVAVAIFTVVNDDKATKERKQTLTKSIASVSGFKASNQFIGPKNTFLFAIDNTSNKVLYTRGNYNRIINFEDIISVELIEDNDIIAHKSTSRTVGGALVGGLVGGGVGAVIGGLSGDSTHSKLHSSVKVKILIRNNSFPSIEIPCYDCRSMELDGKPVKSGSSTDANYKQGIYIANRIVDSISVIIDAIDKAQNVSASNPNHHQGGSVADELAKLAVLKEKGILTEEEFKEQKNKLLMSDDPRPTGTQAQPQALISCDPFKEYLTELIQSGKKIEAVKAVCI